MSDIIRRHSSAISNAEIRVLNELGGRGYAPTMQKSFCLQQTVPDFYFSSVNLAIYLDGEQVHKHPEKDEELRRLLTKRHGVKVLSYGYKAPITKARLKEIADHIEDTILGLRRDMC